MTNHEYIRSLSVEQMARMFEDVHACPFCACKNEMRNCDYYDRLRCFKGIKLWLESEMNENDKTFQSLS